MPSSEPSQTANQPNVTKKRTLRVLFDCDKCPAYCCSYERIAVTTYDIARLARHFGLEAETAEQRFTKFAWGERVLRHKKDEIYGTICRFLDSETRRCTVYKARPSVCRSYPDTRRCGYYEFLSWERKQQDDPDFIPLRKG